MWKPIFLWTDILLYILVAAIIIFICYERRTEQFRRAWQNLVRKRLIVASMLILLIYVIIGLLDSIHIQINDQQQGIAVKSVFDLLVNPLGEHEEKTYSAPFAKHLYVKDFILDADGTLHYDYPTLRYQHVLGTDRIGRDVFYLSLKSIRTGLVIGTLTTLVILPFAILFGLWAGYFRGWVDDIVQYVYTTLSSVPDVLLIAVSVLALQLFITSHPDFFPTLLQQADIRLLALCIILGITSWTGLCRLLRGETLKLRELDYVQAAQALGTHPVSILIRHILPNVMHIILITLVMEFSGLVLAEAVLTYVGVGVDPTTISWGNMINAARQELSREPMVWWPLLSAFIFMFPLVITANFFADAVRDALDPQTASSTSPLPVPRAGCRQAESRLREEEKS